MRLILHSLLILAMGAALNTTGATLAWQTRAGHRIAPVNPARPGRTGFQLLTPAETGVTFTNVLSPARASANANLMNGSGVAVGDFDGDGLPDIYFCNLNGTNALYKNLGDWKFRDVTVEAGVTCYGQACTGAVFADVDGDGKLDLIVTSMGGPNALFINQGNGHFINTIETSGLKSRFGATSIALADVNGDGVLDLFICNYGLDSPLRSGASIPEPKMENGKWVFPGRYRDRLRLEGNTIIELGEPSALYLNDGQGHFTQVPWLGGAFLDEHGKPITEIPRDQSLSVIFRDLNGDGAPDLYICNDANTPDRCWLNDGKGHFRALPNRALRQTSYFSMGVDFADLDRDGFDDFLVVDMQSRQHALRMTQIPDTMLPQPHLIGDLDSITQLRRNTLFRGRGDGTFAEIGNFAGITSTDWTWSILFLDVDLDGWEDLIVSNGFEHNVDDLDFKNRLNSMGTLTQTRRREEMQKNPRLVTPNYAFRNKHDLTFEEVGHAWGFDSPEVSNGMAFGDFDNDGDLDVVVNTMNGPALLYRNESAAPRIAVRLKGKAPNTQGTGAKLKITGGPVTQTQEVMAGGRYVSGDDPVRVFAAGTAAALDIEVTWRNGTRSVVKGVPSNHYCEIDEAGAVPVQPGARPTPAPIFVERTDLLDHQHREDAFDDFARQPLLPHKLSQSGPGVAWFDLDGDGIDELIVGSARGAAPSVFKRDAAGKFTPLKPAPGASALTNRDQTTILGWTPAPGRRGVLAATSSWQDGDKTAPTIVSLLFENGAWTPHETLAFPDVAGPMALADVNGDGSLDLFVGGRAVPGRYPEPASSALFLNQNGKLERSGAADAIFKNLGLVTGAVFTDLNGDGQPDLAVACEWGPVRIFLNNHGVFTEATQSLGLSGLTGWWTGIAAADIDGDGRMDLIVGNWGLNTPYEASPKTPARLFYGDFTGRGEVDMLEAYDPPDFGKTAPLRNLAFSAVGLPFLRGQFPTYHAYAAASVADVLGARMPAARELRATTLATTLFLNRGDHFDAVPLPAEAQFAPVFGLCVADFDGDGHEDVFLAQNFSGTRGLDAVYNAGRGLLLLGGENSALVPQSGENSGVILYGDQRGAAAGDFDGDGRPDLIVAQNGGVTQLLQNRRGRPGLRIRLQGPAGNPSAVGAQLRWTGGGKSGPMREIQAGGGYWSQNSAVQVMAVPATAESLAVRWPGGRVTTSPIPAGQREVDIATDGKLTARP